MYGFTNPYKNLTVTAQWEPHMIRIYDGTNWRYAIPYIYNGSTWKEAEGHVYNGSNWVKIGSAP
jgi:hypothetical protein